MALTKYLPPDGILRGADLVAESLRQEEVPFVVGITGGSTFELFDAIRQVPEIDVMVARHERCAVDIADGYGRVSGKPGVALVVQGPGGANAFAGLSNSFADSAPVVLLQGMIRQHWVDRGATQDTDMMFAYTNVVRWKSAIPTIERVSEIMRRAFSVVRATRPGPVVVGIPANISGTRVETDLEPYHKVGQPRLLFRPDAAEIDRAAQMLLSAENPLLYAGGGVLSAEASPELRELSELLGAPVMTTLIAKGAISERHPLALGLGGFPASRYTHKPASEYFPRADVVLAIGANFKQQATLYRPVVTQPKLIHIDADPTSFNKSYPADVALFGDAKSALRDLVDAVRQYVKKDRDSKDLQAEIARWRAEEDEFWADIVGSDESPVSPHRLMKELRETFDPDDTIILHDSGSSRGMVVHHWVATQPRGVLGFGGQSSMGWSTGAAIGAKLAAPNKHVIQVVGDGAFGMTGFELATAAQYGIKVITIVLNNGGLDASRGAAQSALGRAPDTDWFDLTGDYETIGRGLGCDTAKVERPQQLRPAFEKAIQADRPFLIDMRSKYMARDATFTEGNRFEL